MGRKKHRNVFSFMRVKARRDDISLVPNERPRDISLVHFYLERAESALYK